MKKGLETTIYSVVGVAAAFALLIAVNAIGSRVKQRIDLTAEKAYTLSAGTKAILSKLDTPVQIRFYSTRNSASMPVPLKTYAQRVEDLLGEYQQQSKGLIQIEKFDPEPESDAEDSAKLDGVEPQRLPNGDPIYLGLSVTMLDEKEALPFLAPDRDRLLEYDISRAISRVATPTKPVVGIMSPLQITGNMSPMLMQMGRGGQPAWAFYNELKKDFNAKSIEMSVDKIPDDVKVLVLIHPKAITDVTQFAIDQFILRGGKLVAFLDPLAALDPAAPGAGQASSSSIDKLLKAWGLTFDTKKVVADMDYVTRFQRGREPSVLTLTEKAMNKEDILTASVDNLAIVFSGAFIGTPVEGLKETVLIKASGNSELTDPIGAQIGGGEDIVKNFKSTGIEYALAVRLSGKFKTAFPDGKPKVEDATKPAEEKKPDQPAETVLKESEKENAVILIGDSDLLQDQVAVREVMNPFGGERMFMPANGNLGFAQSIVDQMTGEDELISVRSRASLERPFTVVKAMEAKAEERFSSKIKDLVAKQEETIHKLSELQQAKPGGGAQAQQFIMSPEQEQAKASFLKDKAKTDRELRQVKKDFRRDIDSLSTRLKWLNVGLIPFLVALVGILLAIQRRKNQAAR